MLFAAVVVAHINPVPRQIEHFLASAASQGQHRYRNQRGSVLAVPSGNTLATDLNDQDVTFQAVDNLPLLVWN